MKTVQTTCGSCLGSGHNKSYEPIPENPNTLRSQLIKCKFCNGKGYTEYAVFSVEEAEAILKHCGLNKE